MEEPEVTLNNKKIAESIFKLEKEKLEKNKGIKVIEVCPGSYKTRIQE